MSWITVTNGRRVLCQPPVGAVNELLSVGSILLEVQFDDAIPKRRTIFSVESGENWPRRIAISIGAGGDVLLEHRQGSEIVSAMVKFPKPDAGATLRLTMSWHAPERLGILTVENLESGETYQRVYERALPVLLGDLAELSPSGAALIDPDVTLLAVSDSIIPVELRGGFAENTLVDTIKGPCRVQDLRPGDLVQTSEHGMQPVRHIACYDAPCLGRFAPVHLNAPFFGLKKDIVVSRDHRMLISGADAEYLFGTSEVLVEASYLDRITSNGRRHQPTVMRFFHVILDAHVCLSVGGAWAESMFLGDMAEDPARLATSVLANLPAAGLPVHTRTAGTQLHGYEAAVLVSAMCA